MRRRPISGLMIRAMDMSPFSHHSPPNLHGHLSSSHPPSQDGPFHQLPTIGFPPDRHDGRVEAKDPNSARKLQKADREKLRRDKLNEQFLELGTALDPDRPKNDKATILSDAVEMLKDLTTEVKRLKSEHASLSEESSELIQEKNELRDEKATLKSNIDSLNFQYQQRMSAMFPWAAINPTVPVGASPVSFPAPTPIPDSNPTNTQAHVHAPFMPPFMPFPIHPSLQPLPFFSSPTPDMTDQYFAFPPYTPHVTQSHVERPSAQYPSMQPLPTYLLQLQPLLPNSIPNSESHSTSLRESRNETSEFQQPSNVAQSSISDSRRECSRNGRKASEFCRGMDATKSTDCGNKSSDSKCMAATTEVKDSARVMPATSCHSSSLECSSQEPEKVKETSGETRKTTDSASCTRSSPAGVG